MKHATHPTRRAGRPTTPISLWRARRFRLLVGVLAVSLVLLAGCIAYLVHTNSVRSARELAENKARFTAAEHDLAAAYTSVVQAAGQPYEVHTLKACSYGSVKYDRGPLGCTIAYKFSYPAPNHEAGATSGQTVLSAVNGKHGLSIGSVHVWLDSLNQPSGDYDVFLDDEHGLGCSLTHNTYAADEYNLDIITSTPRLTKRANASFMSSFSLECERDIPQAVYPIEGN
ncbi:MAG TPA: hypothetical protein VHC98_03505 [Candidatus Saccharimonadales bacterium]|nr:hypothetical protein [Candidatus Saccharimonadales bacterium]